MQFTMRRAAHPKMEVKMSTYINKAKIYALLLAAFFGMSAFAVANDALDRWSKGDIAGLFPPKPEGWRVSSIDLERMDTPTSELERFTNAFNENFDAKTSIRLRAIRDYISNGQKITVTIDTDDIDSAINIDAMLAASESDDHTTRTHLESEGFSTKNYDGRTAVAFHATDKIGRAFKIGSTGVVALECSYFDCAEILDSMIAQIDFSAVAEFVSANHWYRLDDDN